MLLSDTANGYCSLKGSLYDFLWSLWFTITSRQYNVSTLRISYGTGHGRGRPPYRGSDYSCDATYCTFYTTTRPDGFSHTSSSAKIGAAPWRWRSWFWPASTQRAHQHDVSSTTNITFRSS